MYGNESFMDYYENMCCCCCFCVVCCYYLNLKYDLILDGEGKLENKYSKLFTNIIQSKLEYKYDLIWIQLEHTVQLQKFLKFSVNWTFQFW